MMPTFSERLELAQRFAGDLTRMQRCLQANGKHAPNDEVVYAWVDYSSRLCAGWLMLPESDETLLKILLKHLPSSPLIWQGAIQGAGDGSGDQIVKLPAEIFEQMGWKEGDTLRIGKLSSDKLVLQRAD